MLIGEAFNLLKATGADTALVALPQPGSAATGPFRAI